MRQVTVRAWSVASVMVTTLAACDQPVHAPVSPPETHFELETPQWATVGNGFRLQPPGGPHPQNAYVTEPNVEVLSNVASAELDPPGLWVECKEVGDAWIRVLTENGFWKIYPLTCTARLTHNQGEGG
jgi:hypothetical protein